MTASGIIQIDTVNVVTRFSASHSSAAWAVRAGRFAEAWSGTLAMFTPVSRGIGAMKRALLVDQAGDLGG